MTRGTGTNQKKKKIKQVKFSLFHFIILFIIIK